MGAFDEAIADYSRAIELDARCVCLAVCLFPAVSSKLTG
jgi:hypothetical protein